MVDTWQSGFVAANGVTLHYTRTGGDKPVVVLAHGVTDAGPCWGPVAEALQDEYDLIMVDARGHGASTTPESGYGPDAQAEDLAGALRLVAVWLLVLLAAATSTQLIARAARRAEPDA